MRCLRHQEYGAAALALSLFAENVLQVIYLLNFRYAPYYKWAFKGLEALPLLRREGKLLESILCKGVTGTAPQMIEEITKGIIRELIDQGYTTDLGEYLEPYAVYIQQTIGDHMLRNMPIVIE